MALDDGALFRIIRPCRVDRRLDRAGSDRIDPDAAAGKFERERARVSLAIVP
jgi:hypothetical protein